MSNRDLNYDNDPQLVNLIAQTTEPLRRQNSWTYRLPVDLLSIVLEYLTEDKALGTLAALQSTFRATYSIVTPYLYRQIAIDQTQAFDLFGQFEEFPRCENRLICQPIPLGTHTLDLHLGQRLRACVSNTQTLSLDLRQGSGLDWFARRSLNRYT